jgi:hypothetical protein
MGSLVAEAYRCCADPDALPEAHQLPALIEAELQQLGRSATHARASEARATRP